MKPVAVRPFDAEILLDEVSSVAIHGLGELLGFIFGVATLSQSADLAVRRGIDEHVKSIGARLKVIGGTAPHNHTVAFLCGSLHHSFSNLTDAIGVHTLH